MCLEINFFLLLSNTAVNDWTSLFIHSPAGGPTGFFPVITFMNRAAVHIVYTSFYGFTFLVFEYLVYLKLIWVYGVRWASTSIFFFSTNSQFSQLHLLTNLFFLHQILNGPSSYTHFFCIFGTVSHFSL